VERKISILLLQANPERMMKMLLTQKVQKKPIKIQQADPTKYAVC